jgi:polar amino acid transport system substrate-binding protein
MKRQVFLIFLFCTFLFQSAPLSAEPKEILIATSTGYPPFYYFDKKIKGACPDIIESVFQKMGYQVKFMQYPWKRMLFVGKSGVVHAIMPLFKTEERKTFLHFHQNALAFEENRLFAIKPAPLKAFQSLMDLIPFNIGVVKDYSYGSTFDQADYLNKTEAKSETQLIKLIIKKRIEFGIGSKPVILHYAQESGVKVEQMQFLSPEITKDALYLGFSKAKGTEKLSLKFSETLAQFKQTSAYDQILQKYNLN